MSAPLIPPPELALHGLHHVTAVSADAAANYAFYTGVMGMRLVKKTVNQDDTSGYHLFYADAEGSAGTDLTFFEFNTLPETRGTRAITRTGLRVNGQASLEYWAARLSAHGVTHAGIRVIDNRLTLDFEDPEGQRLSLVDDGGEGEANPYAKSPVPLEHQIRGLGPSRISVPELAPTGHFLTAVYGMELARLYEHPDAPGLPIRVYRMGAGGPAAELHVMVEPDAPGTRPGAGGVHHIAFRVKDAPEYAYWVKRYEDLGLRSSGPVDRFYFRSLYVREPGGILIELATDGPGFAMDEPRESMGESLSLPPFLEDKRARIEAGLKPLETRPVG